MSERPNILFVGGGSGGHIFPNLAVAERLDACAVDYRSHFVISMRPLDKRIVQASAQPYTTVPAQPLGLRPGRFGRFLRGYDQTRRLIRGRIRQDNVTAMVGTGGFVSGPAFAAAREAQVPRALVNLDAVPGRANRLTARKATRIFTAYPVEGWPQATPIGVPLRQAVQAQADPAAACRAFGLAPDKPILLVTAGSQGARSINRLMIDLCRRDDVRTALQGWAVMHLCGEHDRDELASAYAQANVPAQVETFCERMGLVWSAANLAISRAGAGSVAEAWTSATPAIFLPYPHHKDEHQRHNATPLVEAGGAALVSDHDDPATDAEALARVLVHLLTDQAKRERMHQALHREPPIDGAQAVADWLTTLLTDGNERQGP